MVPPQRTIPTVPLVLGLAGLVPFWGLAIGLGFRIGPWSAATLDLALATYAALILSFLGGIHWGLAVAAGAREDSFVHYGVSVVPSLVAWALLAIPEPWRLVGLGLLALALGALDQGLVKDTMAPLWFGRLRLILSGGAGFALLLAASLW